MSQANCACPASLPTPFSSPNEPVLLISGARRAFRHGEDGIFDAEEGRLACRFTGQAVSGLEVTVGDRGYVVHGDQLPAPDLSGLDLPAELADLAAETMILDLSNAPVIAARADQADPWPLLGAIRRVQSAAWNAAVHPPLDRRVIEAISGLLTQYGLGAIPSKTAVQLWSPPWSPLYLDWRIEYRPSAGLSGDRFRDWAPPADNPDPGPDDWSYRWLADQPGPGKGTIEGRTLLTPQAQGALAAQLERVVSSRARTRTSAPTCGHCVTPRTTCAPPTCSASQSAASARRCCSTSRGRSGSRSARRWRRTSIPVACPGSCPAPGRPPAPPPSSSPRCAPATSGCVDLHVVDDFGQVFKVFGAIGKPAVNYHPVRSPDVVTPGWPTYTMLRPRVTQLARLDLPLLSADRDDREVDPQAPGATPLCGWLLASPLDRSISVYHADGTPAGQLVRGGKGVLWWPAPETAPPPHGDQNEARIGNRHLRGLVTGLLRRPDPVRAFSELLDLLADAARATIPDGAWTDEELPIPAAGPGGDPGPDPLPAGRPAGRQPALAGHRQARHRRFRAGPAPGPARQHRAARRRRGWLLPERRLPGGAVGLRAGGPRPSRLRGQAAARARAGRRQRHAADHDRHAARHRARGHRPAARA